MKLENDVKLQLAYEIVRKKILSSKEYRNYINGIVENESFVNSVSKLRKQEFGSNLSEYLLDCCNDIDFIKDLSSVLNKEDEFSKVLVAAIKTDNPIESVVMSKLVEYYYGNSLKEDFDANDELLHLLQAIFGSDILLESLGNRLILSEYINEITGTDNGYDEFLENFIYLYNLIKDEKDYEKVRSIVLTNKDKLNNYVLSGLEKNHQRLDDRDYQTLLDTIPTEFYMVSKKNM